MLAVLLPGFVDTHVHVNEPGTDWEGFATATAAAAAGGVTTLVDMPLDSDPVTTTVAALRIKQAVGTRATAASTSDSGAAWCPRTSGTWQHWPRRAWRGSSASSPTRATRTSGTSPPTQFRAAMARIAELESVLLVHAESHQVIDASPRPSGRGYASFLESRPDAAEEDAVALVVETAAATGARAHVVHVSSARVLRADRVTQAVRVSPSRPRHVRTT